MRLQFNRGFTFADACSVAPYLASLGISHVYASPIMTARRSSMHGYDVVDPTRVNPELGGEDEFRRLAGELHRHGLGLIVDIVPNHMAIGSDNPWWMDVLRRGRGSRYADYFDIDWEPPNRGLTGKLLLPVLGRPYGDALEANEIKLEQNDDGVGFVIRYFDQTFPIAAGEIFNGNDLADFNATSPRGRERLHDLLERQHYRLAWWRAANDEINWRRFFDINELAAIRVENPEVFEAVHATMFRLYREGLIDGVRVDHVDGLSMPEKYCRELRERLQNLENARLTNAGTSSAYIVVEKILARDECLPSEWLTDGTTGYDFMDEVSALLHDQAGESPLQDLWQRVSGRLGDFDNEEQLARRQILEQSFSAQREALVETFRAIAQHDLKTRDCTRAAIRRCLTEILVCFRVYRIYSRVSHASSDDRAFLSKAVERAKTYLPGDAWLVAMLGAWLSGKQVHSKLDRLQDVALARFHQLSAPLCAKAVEDTAFYRYGRLLSRNDVGFDPRQFGCSINEFHRRMQVRAASLPRAMLATATHDHKRGEDVRARLAVLSELPQDWVRAVERWLELSQQYCPRLVDTLMPHAGDLAILFQTVVGAWPLGLTLADPIGLAEYAKRIAAWQRKALREAKLRSDWSEPNLEYEQAVDDYIDWLFSGQSEILAEIVALAQRIAAPGAANGLAEALVKLAAPGIPDLYQGTEYWDLSLVDPDNRSVVDFAARQKSLEGAPLDELISDWRDGRIKQFLIARTLGVRKMLPRLFSDGAYLPLEAFGPMAGHIAAFARLSPDAAVIVAFCRFTARYADDRAFDLLPMLRCKQTCILMPPPLHGVFWDVLRPGQTLPIGSAIVAENVFDRLPVVLLASSHVEV
jgi:(1->4)-alpha-D-glucan 1-alpha-D-glucosylmutase